LVKRIYICVEGQTEEVFVRQTLAPELLAHNVFATAIIIATKRPASGGKFRGGVTAGTQIHHELQRLLNDRQVAAVTTMFDLYGLPVNTPGLAESAHLTGTQRATAVEAAITQQIADARFRANLQVHEFEALVFAAPTQAQARAGQAVPRLGSLLVEAVAEAGSAELVNDDPETAPSKRLSKLWPGYVKTLDGPAIVASAGLDRLRVECPHFGQWLSWLESFA
jgi:Domain of unknown function (DUF4276)